MGQKGFVEGTRGIGYLQAKDERRDKRRCKYHEAEDFCGYYQRKCSGSTYCEVYVDVPRRNYKKGQVDIRKAIEEYRESQKKEKKEVLVSKAVYQGKILEKSTLAVGQKVRHKKLGEGLILTTGEKGILIKFQDSKVRVFQYLYCLTNEMLEFL